MVRPWKIGRAGGVEIALHWTFWVTPLAVFLYGLWYSTADNAVLNLSVLFGVYACVIVQEFAHAVVADRLGIGTRDVILYPICGVARFNRVGERPWQEVWIALAGPVVHGAIAGAIWAWFHFSAVSLAPKLDGPQPYLETFFNRLFWCNVLLAVLNLLPALPLDGGRVFRSALALSAGRLRATEVTALLSTLIALGMAAAGIVWLESAIAVVLALFIYLLSQQELMRARYFASIHSPPPGASGPPTAVAPADQIIDAASWPTEPHFSGFTWNAKSRLWVEWKDGEPVSASAVIGE